MKDMITLGSWAGMWGDSPTIPRQLLDGADLDYLVGDHLAEITMALLARARAEDPAKGFIPDIVRTLAPLLGELSERGVKVVTNGGGLNPAAAADALRAAATEAGVPLRVAHVEGDDLATRANELRDAGAQDMFTGEPLPDAVLTMNAYLGARPIAEALARGADIVVTGRCADSAVILGPLMHEFGWSDDDHDLLSAGSLVGHLVECGPQSLGGLFTDWEDVPGWENMGYPVVDCFPDGTATITKPAGTGGLVTPATVGEQLLYEIGDPGAYILPDVVCDWRDVTLVQEGPDVVRIAGAKGRPPTDTYKATTTVLDGFRLLFAFLVYGGDATGRARRAGEAILARAAQVGAAEGAGPLTETSVEVVGSGDLTGKVRTSDEAVVKIGVRSPDANALKLLGREMASFGLVVQGMTGIAGGRPKPQPVLRLVHVLVPKADVPVRVVLDGEAAEVPVAIGAGPAEGTAPLSEPAALPTAPAGSVRVPLRQIAWARSGDKGNDANIGLIPRRPEFAPILRDQVTAARVAELFGPDGEVRRWELPGLHAINILLADVLGGKGGTSSLRYDPQGKSYGATLLDLEVDVPAGLLDG
jgi:hypothetical protein